jgi:hypothetical protein
MVIAFSTSRSRNLYLVGGSQARERSPEAKKGKIVCIARGAQPVPSKCHYDVAEDPDYEPPIGA